MNIFQKFSVTKKSKQYNNILSKWKLLEFLFLKRIKFGIWPDTCLEITIFKKLQQEICYISSINKYINKSVKLIEFFYLKLLPRYISINNVMFLKKLLNKIITTLFKNNKNKLILLNISRKTKLYLFFKIYNKYSNLKKTINNANIFLLVSNMLLIQFEMLINSEFKTTHFLKYTYNFQKSRNPLQVVGFLKTKIIYSCYD